MNLKARDRKLFLNKHIENQMQMRRWFPIRYIDNTEETGVAPYMDGMHAVVIGRLLLCKSREMQARRGTYLQLKVEDRRTRNIVLISIFGRPFSTRYYQSLVGKTILASGKLKFSQQFGYNLSYEIVEPFGPESFRMIPVYSKIRGMSDETRNSYLMDALEKEEEETVPLDLRNKYGIPEINDALKFVMAPNNKIDVRKGILRILFDDLFYLASHFVLMGAKTDKSNGIMIDSTDLMKQVKSSLSFSLTEDQEKTVSSLIAHMKQGERIHCLVQGDVGCGKTITALLPVIAAAENGYQTCIVAPTKILAEQHFHKLSELLPPERLDVRLFAGKKIKKKDLETLADGTCKIAIGTHCLLQEEVQFAKLSLLIIDEEQKFGVEQRQILQEKSEGVGVISMSATPIPRTLASALYGDAVEIFNIQTKPSGRKKVITQYDDGKRRKVCVDYILRQNQQIYVVCPAIDDFETLAGEEILSTKKAVKLYQNLFPQYKVQDLDGTMNPQETEKILNDFRDGKIQILISTTVVEVGVDVPNATLMILENAERFGLSQMHQLRGRVGRGDKQSYCLLISPKRPDLNKRIDTICKCNDGFEISRIDLMELRHSGNLFGVEQSGINVYVEEMLLYSEAYQNILEDARKLPLEILKRHSNKMLLCEIKNHKKIIIV